MNKTGSAAKVKLSSFDDLFGTEQPQTGTEQVQEIALSELHEFKGHPFKVLDDEKDAGNGRKRQGAWSVDARHCQTNERWRL